MHHGKIKKSVMMMICLICFTFCGAFSSSWASCSPPEGWRSKITDWYLAAIADGYPVSMVTNELRADNVTIANVEENYILFGINLKTRPGNFLSEAVFADSLFGPEDIGDIDADLANLNITARFLQRVEDQLRFRAEMLQIANQCSDHTETQPVIPPMPVVLKTKTQQPALKNTTVRANGSGAISGQVTGPEGEALSNAWVIIIDSSDNGIDDTDTDESGNYHVGSLPAGSYKIYFYPASPDYAPEFYNDKSIMRFADLISVTEGQETSGINAQLELAGSITGTVSNTSGIPLDNISIKCYNLYEQSINSTSTNQDGTYSLGQLKTGSYKLRYEAQDGSYAPEWYNNKPDFCKSETISVTSGSATSGINVQLAEAGRISGKVTDSSGTAIENIRVYAYDAYDYGNYNARRSALTDASGNYTITGLAPGTYKVRYEDDNDNYLTEWYNSGSHYCSANELSVAEGQHHTGINAALEIGGSISGTIRDPDGNAHTSGYISAYDSDYNWAGYANIDNTGAYVVKGLESGNYRVRASDQSGTYESIWYDNQEAFSDADDVSVNSGEDTSGINLQFTTESGGGGGGGGDDDGYVISGYVYDANGSPVSNCDIRLRDADTGGFTDWSSSEYETGAYQFSGVSEGSYKIYFDAQGARPQNCISEWYNQKPDIDSADTITVTDSDVTDINAWLEYGGTIKGQVTTPAGTPLTSGYASVVDTQSGYSRGANINCGSYAIQGLPIGNYDFMVRPESQYYYSRSTSASPISVTAAGQIVTHDHTIDSEQGGGITGRVTYYKDGEQVWPFNGSVYIYEYQDGSDLRAPIGNYYFSGYDCGRYNYDPTGTLPPGDYLVNFQNYTDSSEKWYNHKVSVDNANTVEVLSGQTTTGIDCIFGSPGTAALPAASLLLLDE